MNRSESTRQQYLMSVSQFITFLHNAGIPEDPAKLGREHVETFLADFAASHAPATVQTRYKCLRLFFSYLLEESEISTHPMANMKPPQVPAVPVPVLDPVQLASLLDTCKGKSFEERRDNAALRLFIDTGMRRGELAGLRVDDIDFETDVAVVVGKGRRPRVCPFGARTGQALDRYLRERGRRPDGALPWLWLGRKGRLTDSGFLQMVKRRGREAGLGEVHPHQLRHSFAHDWLAQGGQEGELMRLAGWGSRQMLQRYAASAGDERARASHRRMGLGDRL